MGMFHEIMIDLREYRLRRRRLKWSRLYIKFCFINSAFSQHSVYIQIYNKLFLIKWKIAPSNDIFQTIFTWCSRSNSHIPAFCIYELAQVHINHFFFKFLVWFHLWDYEDWLCKNKATNCSCTLYSYNLNTH